jgi:hypothetical protein
LSAHFGEIHKQADTEKLKSKMIGEGQANGENKHMDTGDDVGKNSQSEKLTEQKSEGINRDHHDAKGSKGDGSLNKRENEGTSVVGSNPGLEKEESAVTEREKHKHVKHGKKADTPIHVSNTSEKSKRFEKQIGTSKKTDETVEKIDKSKKTSKLVTWIGASKEKVHKKIDKIKKTFKSDEVIGTSGEKLEHNSVVDIGKSKKMDVPATDIGTGEKKHDD